MFFSTQALSTFEDNHMAQVKDFIYITNLFSEGFTFPIAAFDNSISLSKSWE